jgi:hypothetical protein
MGPIFLIGLSHCRIDHAEVEGAPRARGVSAVTRDLRTGLDELFAYFGMFLSSVTKAGPDGKPATTIEPVSAGSDIQSIFFDMLRQDHRA